MHRDPKPLILFLSEILDHIPILFLGVLASMVCGDFVFRD